MGVSCFIAQITFNEAKIIISLLPFLPPPCDQLIAQVLSCDLCPAGYGCGEGSSSPEPCLPGEYSPMGASEVSPQWVGCVCVCVCVCVHACVLACVHACMCVCDVCLVM